AGVAASKKNDESDRRLPHGGRRRSRDGGSVGRQRQLGPAPGSRRPAAARADPLLAGRRQRRFRLQGIQTRAAREDVSRARMGVPYRAYDDWGGDGRSARIERDAMLAVGPLAPRRGAPDSTRG